MRDSANQYINWPGKSSSLRVIVFINVQLDSFWCLKHIHIYICICGYMDKRVPLVDLSQFRLIHLLCDLHGEYGYQL